MAFDLNTLTPQQAIAAIYIGYYERAADPFGNAFWEDAFANPALDLSDIATFFADQDETQENHPFFVTPTPGGAEAFITDVYQNLFNRAPDADGLEFWSEVLQDSINGINDITVGEIILQIIGGAQNTAAGNDLTTIQNKINAAVTWTNALEAAGLTEATSYENDAAAQASARAAINVVDDSADSMDLVSSTIALIKASMLADTAAEKLADAALFQDKADAAEAKATTQAGAAEFVEAAAVVKSAAEAAVAAAFAATEAARDARLAAAETDETEDDADAAAAFAAAIAAVAEAEAALVVAEAGVEAAAAAVIAAVPGDDFALTIGVDELDGTTGVDVFTAPLSYNVTTDSFVQTLEQYDVIDGGSGIDSLYAALELDSEAPVLTSVENLFLEARDGGINQTTGSIEASIDLNNADSVQQLWNNGSSSDLDVSEVQNGVTIGMKNVDKGTAFYVGYADGAFEDDHTQALVLEGVGTKTASALLDIAGGEEFIKDLSITATGVNNLELLYNGSGPNVENITISGSGELFLVDGDNTFDEVMTVDASGFAGDLTLNISGNGGNPETTGVTSVVSGSGDDVIGVDERTLTNANSDKNPNNGNLIASNDTILDGGDGDDVLVVTIDDYEFEDDDLSFDLTNVSNFETLVVAGGYIENVGADFDLSGTDFTALELDFTVDLTGNDSIEGPWFGVEITGDADFDSITFSGGVFDGDESGATYGLIVLDGFETLDLTVSGEDMGSFDEGINIDAEELVDLTFTVEDGESVYLGDLFADALETLTVNIAGDKLQVFDGPQGGSVESLETINVSGDTATEFYYQVDESTTGLTTLDLSQMSGFVDFDLYDDNHLESSLQVLIGDGSFAYNGDEYEQVDVREIFSFVGDDIGAITVDGISVEIGGFTVSNGGNGDRLDFSNFDAVSGLEDLTIAFDEGDTYITSTGFSGEILILGANLSDADFNFVF
ncbi:MAG: DUF4214 domain-containing protein [Marivita sp.]|uniref:DUF4214 domain-containing protein n=1 Tax=Marivita sp. TaxID=2003365 RepID=UPI003EF7B0F1